MTCYIFLMNLCICTRAKRRSSHSRPVRPHHHGPIHVDSRELFFVALKTSFSTTQSPNAANQTPQTPAHLQYPGRLGGRPDPPHLRHAGNEDAEVREARPNAATPSGSLTASSQESGSYLAQLTPRNQRWSTSTTVHVEECHGPVPNERDEGLQTLNEVCDVTNVNKTCHLCHHRHIRVARDICGPSGKGREEELEIEGYGVPLYCDLAEELG
ncbi:hypothetical protein CNYM01_03827 [Colletotrichum nymphaeae SA-01]|uniref:Uncharacterized protein n=1 Tax=Colletotrichum nymphaeae SA-01 TaxID=1460502 RepID=A0A135T304_9PEZI|nr:hypothetical protein CNYM01_03827 [Colletotrichum nymphaeae SA-01]